ncbi:E3 ubiquitin-protein ligase siah-1-like [Cydia fagiglandana]|uniref:E3 ubiquitin-protein ligase siah-1-like n=1 Tax=Cydia fagiglandana TaxID=1458189 RepID=UPI002FEDFBAF
MSRRNDGANNETRELDSSDEETPINPEVRILSRIFGVHRASVASMPGTSGASHLVSPLPNTRRTPRERDRLFWTLLGNSSRLPPNARCRSGPPPRGPRPTTYADLLEPDRRSRIALTRHASPAGSGYQPNASQLSSLHCSLRNILRKRPYTTTGNVTGPSSRPVLVLHAAPESSRGEDESDGRGRIDRDRSDRDRDRIDRDRDRSDRDRDRGDRDRSTREHERHHDPEPIDLDDIEEPVPGPAPAFSPRADADAEYFADETMRAEEPLNMSTGALLEEEILEVEPGPEPAPRPAGDNETEPADTPAESSQQRGTKRKREGETQDSALALNHSILRLLECPVCMEWMEAPITQCRRGHLVCGACRKRLDACPVCRTPFSSVRNRAMEDVAGVLRYPCRHGCGRFLRAPRRRRHEASCAARRHACPLPACRAAPPLPRDKLQHHAQTKHPESFKTGTQHVVALGVRCEQHVQLVVAALGALFHVRVDMDVRTWGVSALVQHLGPQDQADSYTYEVTVNGRHSGRRLVYRRVTHSDLENPVLNTSRQDCFHLTLDQALNYLRFKNEHSETDKTLDLVITLAEAEPEQEPADEDT